MTQIIRRYYPVFIYEDIKEKSEYKYLAYVTDLDLWTQGKTFKHAEYMAWDIIGMDGLVRLDNKEELPPESTEEEAIGKALGLIDDEFTIDFSQGELLFIEVDFEDYKKSFETFELLNKDRPENEFFDYLEVKQLVKKKCPMSRGEANFIYWNVDSEGLVGIGLDFAGIENVGRSFVDEIFRVFHNKYPDIELQVVNMNENVDKAIKAKLDENQ